MEKVTLLNKHTKDIENYVTPFYFAMKDYVNSLDNTYIKAGFYEILNDENYFTLSEYDYYINLYDPFKNFVSNNQALNATKNDIQIIQDIFNCWAIFISDVGYYNFNKTQYLTLSVDKKLDNASVVSDVAASFLNKIAIKLDSMASDYASLTNKVPTSLVVDSQKEVILFNLCIYYAVISFYKKAVTKIIQDLFAAKKPRDFLDSKEKIRSFVNDVKYSEFFMSEKINYEELKKDMSSSNYTMDQIADFNSKILSGYYDKAIITELVYLVTRIPGSEGNSGFGSCDDLVNSFYRRVYSVFYNFATSEKANFLDYLITDDEFSRMQLTGVELKNIIKNSSSLFLHTLYKLVFGFVDSKYTDDMKSYLVLYSEFFRLLGTGFNIKKTIRGPVSINLKASTVNALILGAKLSGLSVLEAIFEIKFGTKDFSMSYKELFETIYILKQIVDKAEDSENPRDFIEKFTQVNDSVDDMPEYKKLYELGGGIVCRKTTVFSSTVASSSSDVIAYSTPFDFGSVSLINTDSSLFEILDSKISPSFNLYNDDPEFFYILQYLNLKHTLGGNEGPLYLDAPTVRSSYAGLTEMEKTFLKFVYSLKNASSNKLFIGFNDMQYSYPELLAYELYTTFMENKGNILTYEEANAYSITKTDEYQYEDNGVYLKYPKRTREINSLFITIFDTTLYQRYDAFVEQTWRDSLENYLSKVPLTIESIKKYCIGQNNANTLMHCLVEYLPSTFLIFGGQGTVTEALSDAVRTIYEWMVYTFEWVAEQKADVYSLFDMQMQPFAVAVEKNFSLSKRFLILSDNVMKIVNSLDKINDTFDEQLKRIDNLFEQGYFDI